MLTKDALNPSASLIIVVPFTASATVVPVVSMQTGNSFLEVEGQATIYLAAPVVILSSKNERRHKFVQSPKTKPISV